MRRGIAVLLLLLGISGAAFGQDATSGAAADPVLMQRRLALVLRQASQLYEAGDYRGALDHLGRLEGSAAHDLSVLNLRGAVLTKLGDYDQARQLFESILAADPSYFPAAFNLGEVQFVRGDYEAALVSFEDMRRRDPRNELVRFKVLLSHLLLGRDDAARAMAAGLIPAGNTPAWYYAQAVIAKKGGDNRSAEKHLAAAREIYGADGCKLFEESIGTVKF